MFLIQSVRKVGIWAPIPCSRVPDSWRESTEDGEWWLGVGEDSVFSCLFISYCARVQDQYRQYISITSLSLLYP